MKSTIWNLSSIFFSLQCKNKIIIPINTNTITVEINIKNIAEVGLMKIFKFHSYFRPGSKYTISYELGIIGVHKKDALSSLLIVTLKSSI